MRGKDFLHGDYDGASWVARGGDIFDVSLRQSLIACKGDLLAGAD